MHLFMKAIIMGIVEGLTEFLPVSSTGHLIIAGDLINFKGRPFHIMFEIVIQLGAIFAVIFYYRHKIISSFKELLPGQRGFRFWLNIFIAFLPSAILGVLINDYIERYLFSSFTVAIALILGGFLMILAENVFGRYGIEDLEEMTPGKSLIVGISQCLSLFPGMSRSASTIMGGMAAGLSVKAAAEFSFFLAIPTMLGATTYSLMKGFSSVTAVEWKALGVGFAVSFIVALLAVDRFLAYLTRHSLKTFAYYRILIGALMLFLVYAGVVG